MKRSFATLVVSIARGLCCLRDAFTVDHSTLVFAGYFAVAMSLAGCGGGGGSTGGGPQQNPQTITFTQPTSPVTYTAGLTVPLSATATSGLAVTFSVDSASTGKATVSGNTLTVTGAGKIVVDANQAGNASYYAAAQVSVTIVVNPAGLTITWPTPAAITYGTALSGTQLDATANVAGSFIYSPTAGTVPKVGTQTLSVTFTPTDTTDYTTATATVQLVVNQAGLTITWPTPAAITYGTALSGTQLDATANVAGSFIYSPAAGTVPKVGTQTLSVTFTPTDTTDYTTATATVQLVVNQAVPTVSVWPTASAIASGQALSASTLTGGAASVPGSFAWTAPSTIPAVGTDSENVAFTPTDATDYQVVVSSISVVVNPTTPQITALTPRYMVSDNYLYNLSSTATYTFTCSGCQNGDTLHDASGMLSDITSVPGQTNIGINVQWQPGTYQPWFLTFEFQHPGGAYGNQYSTAFLGSASQSTLAISPTTGTLFQYAQASGDIYFLKADGTKGSLFSTSGTAQTPINIAIDDASGNIVYSFANSKDIAVLNETGTRICDVVASGMSFVSSIAARGGYMVFADPTDNLIGIAKMDCSGYKTISAAGQPWSVAMTNNGTETDAYVLFRDAWSANGRPGVVKYVAPAMTVAGSVELANVPTVSSVRATAPLEGVYQLVAFTNTPVAAVLFMSGQTDGMVLLVSTNTSGSNVMKVTQTTPVTELPFALATQETASASTLWVAYIKAAGGDNVTYAGTVNLATGNYTSDVGTFPAGILAGGFAASATQVYGAQGSTIAPLQQ